MTHININNCIECGLCLKVCKNGPIIASSESSSKPVIDKNAACLKCGHCLCVCSQNAIEISEIGPAVETVQLKDKKGVKYYNEFIKLAYSRRSVRNYLEKPPSDELINMVIQAARCSPTAKNSRGVCVTLIKNGDVKRLAELTFDFYNTIARLVKSPFKKYIFALLYGYSTMRAAEKNIASFERGYKMHSQGIDMLFYDAPVLLIVHSSSTDSVMPADDCAYAVYAMTLAAESLGLATCINGFFKKAAAYSDKIKKYIKLPRDHEVHGALTLGFPAVEYQKLPPRNPIHINRL